MNTTAEIKSLNTVIKKLQAKHDKQPEQKIYGCTVSLALVIKELELLNKD